MSRFYGLYTSMHCRKLIHFNDDFNGFGAYSAKLWIKIWMTQMLVSTMIGKTLFRWQAFSDFWNVTVKAWITWMLLLYIVSLWKSRLICANKYKKALSIKFNINHFYLLLLFMEIVLSLEFTLWILKLFSN